MSVALTSWPASARAATVAEPTLPRAPVTRMRIRRSYPLTPWGCEPDPSLALRGRHRADRDDQVREDGEAGEGEDGEDDPERVEDDAHAAAPARRRPDRRLGVARQLRAALRTCADIAASSSSIASASAP